jgi:molybdate transport system regulatory protein
MDAIRKKQWELRSKVWLELEGQPFMGEGRVAMLRAIDRFGSIINAARETGISYRRIRGALRDMEKAIGRPLVQVHRGGEEGGGALLTEAAHELLKSFEKCTNDLQNEADVRFEDIFR